MSPLKWQFAFSNRNQTHIHACCPKRLPLVLGVEGAEGVCSKSQLLTTHNHHHHHRRRRRHDHLFLQLLLKVFIVARVFFKRPRRRGGWGWGWCLSCPSPSEISEPAPNTRVPPRLPLGEDAREGLCAGRGGGRVRRREGRERKGAGRESFIFSIAICQLRTRAKHTRAPTLALKDLAQDVAEDVLGAAKDGSVHREGFILPIVICQRRNPRHACPLVTLEGRARQGRGAERCGRRCGGRATGRGAGIDLRGPGGARHPRFATTAAAAAVFVYAEIGAQLGSSVAPGPGCGQALSGVPRKAPLCLVSWVLFEGALVGSITRWPLRGIKSM